MCLRTRIWDCRRGREERKRRRGREERKRGDVFETKYLLSSFWYLSLLL
jgi:hypothetical protein